MQIKLDLYEPDDLEAFGVFLTTVAAKAKVRNAENAKTFGLFGGIDKASNPMWQSAHDKLMAQAGAGVVSETPAAPETVVEPLAQPITEAAQESQQ